MYKEIVRFIREAHKTPEAFLPLHEPRFVGNERKYVMDAIDSTFVSSVGAYVDRFEEMMAKAVGAKYAVALVNGTNALHICQILAGVKPGDEVITQPLTFIATANAISYQGAIPHFVDVEEDSMGLSPSALRKRLELIAKVEDGKCINKMTGRRIAACIPMHTFGLVARIEEIVEVCNEFHIPVIEDAAESLGSYSGEKHTGTIGLLGTFSFNGNKTVTCGGGGAIVTNDEALAKRAKHLTTQAKIPHRWEYAHDAIGFNYRMPNLNAAMACAQLEMLDQFVENKRTLAKEYQAFFKDLNKVTCISERPGTTSNYWLNALRFTNKKERDEFLLYTNDHGVMTRPIWKLMNDLEMFKDCPKGELVNARKLDNTIVNIPSSVRI